MHILHGQDSSSSSAQHLDISRNTMKCPICQEKADKKCSACKSVAYCCVEHQKLDWKNHKKVCQPPQAFTIKKTKNMGLGWFATRDLKVGEVVLEEFPIIQAPVWKPASTISPEGRMCTTCGIKSDILRSCSTCSWPVCSDECEKNPLHMDNECKEFVSRKLKYPPPAVWSAGMLTLCMRANVMKTRDPKKFQQLMALQDFYDIPSSNQELQKLDLPTGMFEVLRGPNCLTRDEFRKLLRIVKVSGFGSHGGPARYLVSSKEFHVFLKVSRLNHSCMANCMNLNGSGRLAKVRIVPIEPIRKGEQLTIDYFENPSGFGSTFCRQGFFKRYGLFCKCKKCLDPTELGTFLSGIKCFNCSSNLRADSDPDGIKVGFLVPVVPSEDRSLLSLLSPSHQYKCHRCSFQCPYSNIFKHLPAALLSIEINIGLPFLAKQIDLKALDTLLTKYEEDPTAKEHFHPNNWTIQAPVRMLVEAQMETLDEMTEEELDKLLRRLEHFLAVGDKLFLSCLFPPKYNDLMWLSSVAMALLRRFGGIGMTAEKRQKLRQICDKYHKVQSEMMQLKKSLA